MRAKKYSLRNIATALNRALSTISDEITRGSVRGIYDPKKSAHKAYVARKYAKYQGMKVVSDHALRIFIDHALSAWRSPESIAGRLKHREKALHYVSKEGIKTYLHSVHGRQIEALRKRQCNVKPRRKRPQTRGTLDGRRFIDKRPRSATKRMRIGDVEADFILSGRDERGILLTVADRRSRVAFVERIRIPTIRNMERAFLKIKKRFPEMKTVTTDNDLLFQQHKRLECLLGVRIYFCHAYHSWEKGTIERTNKEIRKYIPKGSDISFYSAQFITKVERTLNERWMNVLRHAAPREALERNRILKKRRGA